MPELSKDRPAARPRRSSSHVVASHAAESTLAFYRSFVPHAALLTIPPLSRGVPAAAAHAAEAAAAAVLMADISGYTRLCDRFERFGLEGIDALTASLNRAFDPILAAVAAAGWPGWPA